LMKLHDSVHIVPGSSKVQLWISMPLYVQSRPK
jgi:hypothetical protein